jgi:digeranylgeranylglycerophospholipid reductase
MRNGYDVVVVGAGPAGSMAGLHAAKGGASVAIFEKDRDVGIPVRCAEGAGEAGLASVIDIQPKWIANKITGAMLYSPSGTAIKLANNDIGYVLDRKIFDSDLSQMAVRAGAHLLTKAYVHDLLHDNGRVSGVKVRRLGKDFTVKARIVIGADGVESRVGRWAGLSTRTAMKDMETCAQVTAANINVEPTMCHFFFSSHIAPGGYLWVFPKGNGLANVGLGISGEHSGKKAVIDYLHDFLDSRFPDASVLTTVVGGVPCAPPMKKIVTDGLMLVGDAAHQAVALSGGGIVNGMIAGKLAGQVAGAAIREGNVSEKRLNEYVRQWNKLEGKKLKLFYKLKEYVYHLTDDDLEKIADMLKDMPPENITILNIFKKALFHNPALIIDAVKVFA